MDLDEELDELGDDSWISLMNAGKSQRQGGNRAQISAARADEGTIEVDMLHNASQAEGDGDGDGDLMDGLGHHGKGSIEEEDDRPRGETADLKGDKEGGAVSKLACNSGVKGENQHEEKAMDMQNALIIRPLALRRDNAEHRHQDIENAISTQRVQEGSRKLELLFAQNRLLRVEHSNLKLEIANELLRAKLKRLQTKKECMGLRFLKWVFFRRRA